MPEEVKAGLSRLLKALTDEEMPPAEVRGETTYIITDNAPDVAPENPPISANKERENWVKRVLLGFRHL